jgi:uncharacterized protein with PQ loop repeat
MKNRLSAISIVVGIVFGILGGPVFILVPWTVAALILGYFSKKTNEAALNGFLFGFFASFMFMVHGYSGSAPIIHAIPLFLGLGIFGGLCGLVLSFLSFFLKNKFKK